MSIVENKVIVTVSLGAPRTWIMQEKKQRGSADQGEKHKWILENGSLLVMQGSVQQTYTHEIPKEPKVKQSRIVSDSPCIDPDSEADFLLAQSITFRQLVY
jgi:alkylated DNA repair dioxygenase AlkB